MGHTHDEITQHLAERLCWEVARRDDSRVARRLYRKHLVDGVSRRDEGALRDDFWPFLQAIGVMALLEEAHGAAIHREMVPFVQSVLLDGGKPLFGMERSNARPSRLCSDEALMRLVGFNAHQVRQGLCQRGATTRQGARRPGPIGPETLAHNIVQWNLRDLEAVLTGAIRALAKAGGFGAKGTGIADGPDLETTTHDTGCGQVTRKRRIEDTQGRGHEIAVTVYGWKGFRLLDAATKMPRAANVGQSQAHEALWTRALVPQARLHRQGCARRHQVVCERGFGDGPTRWWLDQQGIRLVVPANTEMAVTAAARAQAAAGEELTGGRRVHAVRHGQGRAAWTARLETEGVGITGLTTDDQDGTPEHGRQHHRRDCPPHPINAVVVRPWHGREYGPGGQTGFLTTVAVAKPLQPVDDADDRRLSEHCCLKETKPPWDLGHPPQTSARAVRVHVLLTLLLFALATADRLQCEREALGGEAVGWQRWRRQLREQTRDQVIVCAQGSSGIFHLAEYSRRLGVQLKDVPPEVGSRQQVLAKFKLPAGGSRLCWNFRTSHSIS